MDITITLTGASPLLMHNPRMVDPEFELNRQIKALTSKRKKTDDDLQSIERMGGRAGSITPGGEGPPAITHRTSKVRKCLINTGRISKMGKMVERAVSFGALDEPLIYEGPKDVDLVFADA